MQPLTIIAVKDKKSERHTAFIQELPSIIVVGDSEDDIKSRLEELLTLAAPHLIRGAKFKQYLHDNIGNIING